MSKLLKFISLNVRGAGGAGILGLLVVGLLGCAFIVPALWVGIAFYGWLVPLLVASNMAGWLASFLGFIASVVVGVVSGQICFAIFTFLLQLLGLAAFLGSRR